MSFNRLNLLRIAKNPNGCFGVLLDANLMPFAVTLENEETLIPNGTHICNKSYYYAGNYPTFEIIVSGRSRILFHKLNYDHQSKGCVGIAESFDVVSGTPGVSQSHRGFTEFWEKYKQFDTFLLVVREFRFEEGDN